MPERYARIGAVLVLGEGETGRRCRVANVWRAVMTEEQLDVNRKARRGLESIPPRN